MSQGGFDAGRAREFLWPAIASAEAARDAATRGVIAAVFVALYAAFSPDLSRSLDLAPTPWLNVAAAAAWALLAFGIRSMSRLAAGAALILFVLERGAAFQHSPRSLAILLALFFVIFFITAVRATLRYHELTADPPGNERPPR
ncbi:MAG: hypothetical protein EXQ91_01225 [Alphaproteobacteria bacterium]|nr:hypothetical protein [Alphaproteobacteria bacterium]